MSCRITGQFRLIFILVAAVLIWNGGEAKATQGAVGELGDSAREDSYDVLVINDAEPQAFFGFYRATQMTEPVWSLLRRTIDWADGMRTPALAKILLFTYDGDLEEPVNPQQADGYEVYNWLQSEGFTKITSRRQLDMPILDVAYFQEFDLILYWTLFGQDATNALASGTPFISISLTHAVDMNLGADAFAEFRRDFCVVNTHHYPTEDMEFGLFSLESAMWVNGITASGEGVVLITNTCEASPVRASNWSHVKALYD